MMEYCNLMYFPVTEIEDSEIQNLTGRRTKLPVPRPDTEGLSLWNLLCKNIGKDLSQISMPVALNEPLNMLQVRFLLQIHFLVSFSYMLGFLTLYLITFSVYAKN